MIAARDLVEENGKAREMAMKCYIPSSVLLGISHNSILIFAAFVSLQADVKGAMKKTQTLP